jgi:hypothetical protein
MALRKRWPVPPFDEKRSVAGTQGVDGIVYGSVVRGAGVVVRSLNTQLSVTSLVATSIPEFVKP